MIIKRKYFSDKKEEDSETVSQKRKRRSLSALSGLATLGAGSAISAYITEDLTNKNLDKVDNLRKFHENEIRKKYNKQLDLIDEKADKLFKKAKNGYNTGNIKVDTNNVVNNRNRIISANLRMRKKLSNLKNDEINKVREAANRLKKRVSKKMNKRLAIGTGISTLAGIGVGSLVNKKLKERNKRINEEKRNRRK